ncbi:hypothetical protein AN958_02891, partial [Leucoagaricus sp. SymC.cos]
GFERMPPLTLREISMLQIMNQTTDKAEWGRTIFYERITGTWKQEVARDPRSDFTPEMRDYRIEERKCKVEILQTGRVHVHSGDVVK